MSTVTTSVSKPESYARPAVHPEVVFRSRSREEFAEALGMSFREAVELLEEQGLLDDRNILLKLVSLRSSRIF